MVGYIMDDYKGYETISYYLTFYRKHVTAKKKQNKKLQHNRHSSVNPVGLPSGMMSIIFFILSWCDV